MMLAAAAGVGSPWAQAGAVAAVLGAVLWGAWNARQANRAVNSRPKGDPTIYEKLDRFETNTGDRFDEIEERLGITETHDREFDVKGWLALPPDLASAPALTESFRRLQSRQDEAERRLAGLEASADRIEAAVERNAASHRQLQTTLSRMVAERWGRSHRTTPTHPTP